jgi:ABC-type lipoprotein release transport system permease subunit
MGQVTSKVFLATMLALVAIGVGGMLWMAGLVIRDGFRQERELRALSPAERAVVRHELPDGTICYQPREGWSRPLSCLKP